MALIVTTLQAALQATYLAMNNILDDSGNKYEADNTAKAIAAYILTGQTVTKDSGAAPAGSYVGVGTGVMTIDESGLAADLKATFEAKYSNADLAAHMATDIDSACRADNTVKEVSVGMVTTPAGVTVSFSGPAIGKFVGDKSSLESKLAACFETMNSMTSGGNEYHAKELAEAVDAYLKSGEITVELKAPFASGSGEGKIT
jgi:hypothetical protein